MLATDATQVLDRGRQVTASLPTRQYDDVGNLPRQNPLAGLRRLRVAVRPPRFFQCLAHRRYVRGELTDLSFFWRSERSRHGERKLKDEVLLSIPTARTRLKDERSDTDAL